jgi:hypothetical protein
MSSSVAHAQSGFENLVLRIEPPVCFGDTCAVIARFENFQTLDKDLFTEQGELRTCGKAGSASILPADFDAKGKTRTIITVRTNDGLVEKTCNPNFMPKIGIQTGIAFRTFYFPANDMPRFLKFVFRDRKNLVSRTLKANIPAQVPTSDYVCDRSVTPFGTYSRIRNMTLEHGELYTICFDQPTVTPYFPFFEISLINRGDSSCSHVRMRAISPNGQYIVSDYGPSPIVRPNNIAGAWKVQLMLEDGCTKYEMYIDH